MFEKSEVRPNLQYIEYHVHYRKLAKEDSDEMYEMDVTDIFKVFGWDDELLCGGQNGSIMYSFREGDRLFIGYDRQLTQDERFRMLDPRQKFVYKYVRGEYMYGISGQTPKKHAVNSILYVFRFIRT